MTVKNSPRTGILMIGTAFETMGGISAVVNVYRAHGLFERQQIRYLATHRDGGARAKLMVVVQAWLAFLGLLLRRRVGLLHVHVSKGASFWRKSLFIFPAFLLGIPVIVHLHSGGFADFYEKGCGPIRRALIRTVYDRASHVIVLSEFWKQWLLGISSNRRVSAIYNPVLLPAERPWSARQLGTLLTLGRLGHGKGSYDLLKAAALLVPGHGELRLCLAGDGELAQVAEQARALGIEARLSLPGWTRDAAKQALLDQASIYALPSYFEGMPMSVLEAMANGLPVVSTPVGGIPTLVTEGVEGFLVAPGDVPALANRLACLLADPALAQRMGEAGRRKVEQRFSADAVVPQIERIYAELRPELTR